MNSSFHSEKENIFAFASHSKQPKPTQNTIEECFIQIQIINEEQDIALKTRDYSIFRQDPLKSEVKYFSEELELMNQDYSTMYFKEHNHMTRELRIHYIHWAFQLLSHYQMSSNQTAFLTVQIFDQYLDKTIHLQQRHILSVLLVSILIASKMVDVEAINIDMISQSVDPHELNLLERDIVQKLDHQLILKTPLDYLDQILNGLEQSFLQMHNVQDCSLIQSKFKVIKQITCDLLRLICYGEKISSRCFGIMVHATLTFLFESLKEQKEYTLSSTGNNSDFQKLLSFMSQNINIEQMDKYQKHLKRLMEMSGQNTKWERIFMPY